MPGSYGIVIKYEEYDNVLYVVIGTYSSKDCEGCSW